MKTSNRYIPRIAATAVLILGVSAVALAANAMGRVRQCIRA
ncbi:hypothetical protein Thimo_3394 [Thioflavicoccus mobilis 8321]|uniref:Uncharacterized protein n=1 Tax=Thioflavicoccus mobilis 8321 TaxID=765912 RepID=L0GZ87_9GAMM|nr:hypothetical protein [Thioflavicoccus mobilis]AGA92063.1 hypothetical protein Thimo_3394 [Thioflavicoccus mobilis 8321]